MRRYPAFDPPEYVSWIPDPEAMAAFRARVPRELPDETRLLALHEGMLRNRLHDIALKRWVRQGVISKAWLGTGEEAVTVGTVHALNRPAAGGPVDGNGSGSRKEPAALHEAGALLGAGDVVGPMIRNAGACHEMGMPLADLLKIYLGSPDTITRGRDLHTGDPKRGVIPPISFVAALVPVFSGVALSFKLMKQPRVALTWVGDGARWTAEFHEGMNFAAVNALPLILVLQDNQVALGTRKERQSKASCETMSAGYGVTSMSCDGNNVLDVHATTLAAAAQCREGRGPVMLTATTFRMGAHATHDEAEARALFPAETFAWWGRRDPIGMYETWLIQTRGVAAATLARIEERVTQEVDEAATAALAGRAARGAGIVTEADVLAGVHA